MYVSAPPQDPQRAMPFNIREAMIPASGLLTRGPSGARK
jgi:hypothetical protein